MKNRFGIVLLLVAALSVGLASVAFAQGDDQKKFQADLNPLNRSGASGKVNLTLENTRLTTTMVRSHGLAPELPHAQHIPGMAQAISECPTLRAADANGDGLLNTVEGIPFYGPIAVSLTTRGDTSPASGLAVERFPVANEGGALQYTRTFGIPSKVARNLGDFAIVQHGVDLNGNGKYDFRAAGKSELDPSLPQEATIPANCGVIDRVN